VQRKEKEFSSMAAKIEDEQTLGGKYQKQIKELNTRLEDLDEELALERQNRAKAEKARSILSRDIEDLGQKLEDAGNSTATQIEINKKRESELYKLKAELDESNIAHEGTLAALRQKHNSNMAEMGEQIDTMNKMKTKTEKDKSNMERDLQEARVTLNDAMMERANLERNGKLTQGSIVEANQNLDELARALNDAESSKKKLYVEKQDLERQIDELDKAIKGLGTSKVSLTTQLEDTKKLGDAEARDRASLMNKCKGISVEV
jgi:myosin heavy chain 6/7